MMSASTLTVVTAALIGLQGLLLLIDELHYHRRRKLGRFETLSHPIDSFVFLIALAIPASWPPTASALTVYATFAVLSCVLITKDEWVHKQTCEAGEHWLHALLFVIHGPVLLFAAMLWQTAPDARILRLLPLAVGGLCLYQILYWTVYHARSKPQAYGKQHVL